MVKKFGAYCPKNQYCKKGNKCMGTFPTKAQAISWVENHLACSEYHKYNADKAKEEANKTEAVQEWSDDEPFPAPTPPPGPPGSGKGAKKGHQALSAKAKAAPAQIDMEALVSQVAGHLLQLQQDEGHFEEANTLATASASTDMAIANEASQSWTRAISSLTRCEEALKTASRISRSAAQAFDEEAHTIRRELEYLTMFTPQ
jgi:hypothetical protein